jgi:hypothetical protein
LSYPEGWIEIEQPTYNGTQEVRFVSKKAQAIQQKQKAANEYTTDPWPMLDITVYQSLDEAKKVIPADRHNSIINFPQFVSYKFEESKQDDYYTVTDEKNFFIGDTAFYFLGKNPSKNKSWPPVLIGYAQTNGFIYQFRFLGFKTVADLDSENAKILNSINFDTPKKSEIRQKSYTEDDWKVIEDGDLSAEFSIPNDWEAKKNLDGYNFFSPYNLAEKRWCEWQYCESPGLSIIYKSYSSYGQFKSAKGYEGQALDLASYVNDDSLKSNGSVISPTERKIGLYQGYQFQVGGFCGDTNLIFQHNNKIYELTFVCHDGLSETEEKIANSLRLD